LKRIEVHGEFWSRTLQSLKQLTDFHEYFYESHSIIATWRTCEFVVRSDTSATHLRVQNSRMVLDAEIHKAIFVECKIISPLPWEF
jgi:hypothetical protein